MDVKQWVNLEATPYGHFNKVMTRPGGTDASGKRAVSMTGMRVLGDHYTRDPPPLERVHG